jgi:hypothetical protein
MGMELAVELTDLPSTIRRGEFVVPTIRVQNIGSEPTMVSTRLNLFEGDITIWETTPSGERVPLRGTFLVDSMLRQTELAPEQRLEAGVFLSYTSKKDPFQTPGIFRLQAEYTPSVKLPAVTSAPVQVQVAEATTDELLDLTATMTSEVKRAIALAGLDTPESSVIEQLRTIANEYPNRPEGTISRFALYRLEKETNRDEQALQSSFTAWDPVTVAHWITAINSSGETENQLSKEFLTYLEERVDEPSVNIARSIIHCEPI